MLETYNNDNDQFSNFTREDFRKLLEESNTKVAELEKKVSNLQFRADRLSKSVSTYEAQHESVKTLIIEAVHEDDLDREVASSILATLDIEAEREVKVTIEVTVSATLTVGIFDEVDEDKITLSIDGCTIDYDGDETDADWEDQSTSVDEDN